MRKSSKKIILWLPLLLIGVIIGSCTSEQKDQNIEKEGISEKIAALQTTLAQKKTLTAMEKSLLNNMVKKYDRASVTVGQQNRSFNFDDLSNDHIEFNSIKKVPVFESCAEGNRKTQSDCVEATIAQFIQNHFDISAGKNLKVSGIHEVDVSFIIDTNGSINTIKTRFGEKSLQDEAKRVITMLPKMRPGAHKGKKMAALYVVPIRFKVP